MARVLDPLRAMGAKAEGDRLPVTLRGGGLEGISFTNKVASAQVKSAILLAGLHAKGEVEVIEPVPSRDHTENMLRSFGCEVVTDGTSIRLGSGRRLEATSVSVPGDPSSAAFPIVAGLVVPGSEILVRGVMLNPRRAGFVETLLEMGADLRLENERTSGGERVADIKVRSGPLQGVEVEPDRAPSMIDEYPILSVAAAFASGRTIFHGLAELKVKESDRLSAILHGLRACGIEAETEGDSLHILGTGGDVPGGASIAAHHDHRIAMSFLVLGLASRSAVEVDSARMIATSFPTFGELMRSLGAAIE
jgi:3-phosphoshikimate 1-carboxyvinyltransferase